MGNKVESACSLNTAQCQAICDIFEEATGGMVLDAILGSADPRTPEGTALILIYTTAGRADRLPPCLKKE